MCRAHAQGRKYGVSKWEVVVWQERYVHLTESSLVYQRLASSGEPKGKEKEVPFASMQTVKAILGPVLSHVSAAPSAQPVYARGQR
eukprot:6205083-Pleurochrysis_carterae.AAC.4